MEVKMELREVTSIQGHYRTIFKGTSIKELVEKSIMSPPIVKGYCYYNTGQTAQVFKVVEIKEFQDIRYGVDSGGDLTREFVYLKGKVLGNVKGMGIIPIGPMGYPRNNTNN